MLPLKLIVGLGNPGSQYEATRHNVGAVWVREIARRFSMTLASDTKFKGEISRGDLLGVDLRLLVPTTYMNLSGESVGAVCRYYKIAVEEMLVVYDEMAFAPGIVRLKSGGGDNGHNGIKSVRSSCGNNAGFHRMRIGVGHPNDRERVTAYLTQHTIPTEERIDVERATDFPDAVLEDIVHGRWQAAMNVVHAGAN